MVEAINNIMELEMLQVISHTKVYGHGAADILKQNEIDAKVIDSGSMTILLNSNQELIITAVGSVLRFQLVDIRPNFQ